ncbi:MAG: type II toxin-antitoxin system Phd/YefM family antitoxin [Acidobacteriota bacterium]
MTKRTLGVAEAKKRFSELIDRVGRGERFVVSRRGKPAVALVPPKKAAVATGAAPLGLAAVAGALADWEDLDQVVKEIYEARKKAKDRPVPELE